MGNGDMINTAEDLQAKLRKKLQDEKKKTPAEIDEAVKKIAPGGAVWCLDAADGKEIWKYSVPKTILGAVAVSNGKVYAGCQDGILYCLNMKGELVDKWDSHSPIITSPVAAQNTIYVVTQSGTLYGLDLVTFKPVWEVSLDKSVISSPIVTKGRVYVGTDNHGLLCVGSPGTAKVKPVWSGYMGGPGRSGWADGVMLGTKGNFLWGFPKPQGATPAGQVTVPPAIIDESMYVATGGNSPGLSKLLLSEKAPADKPAWLCPSKNAVTISPAATEEFAYFVDGQAGDKERLLRSVKSADGSVAWSVPVSSDASGLFCLVGYDRMMIFDKSGQLSYIDLAAADEKSRQIWSIPVTSDKYVPLVVGQVVYVADGVNLSAIDLPSGQTLWKQALPSPAAGGMVLADNHIWMPCGDSVYCLDPWDGKVSGKLQTGAATSRLVVSGNRLILVNSEGQIVIINAKKVAEETRLSGATVGLEPAVYGDNVLYFADQSIMRYQIPTESQVATSSPTTASSAPVKVASVPTEWMKLLSLIGKPLSPPIVYKSQVFFASEKRGLVSTGLRK
ncbi:MAG: hypothetical protein EHM48_03865 [Planctomycetaceae bacterium]|nr:MAG: hypothetical protein EHM48_03865 [Planctomycetaceae bacterium]